ncbi:aminomethyl-transferring glycine dehydrogenase subunit GcvPA [Christensenellaceae bacterium OttesenSCG-928-K19]|nr:aminomethyl-transferring glycine dehydrogenase subunit GcvPA [Christensenellaceae bacterium OttesenSCG-928-K19]
MGYVPATPAEKQEMLESLGYQREEDLYADIPQEVLLGREMEIPACGDEINTLKRVSHYAEKNKIYRDVFLGAGAYRHFIPAALDALASRGEFVTAYTPYQAEMSQGILQGIFEYQTMICELTGMEVSNASVYDGASATGEACLMARERGRNRILLSEGLNPQVVQTVKTYAAPLGMPVEVVGLKDGKTDFVALKEKLGDDVAAVVVASPNYYGLLENLEGCAETVHESGAKLVAYTNPIAAALLKTPGEQGADITVGDGQPLGMPLAFGGPYVGYIACTKKLMRKMPGRMVGQTQDAKGNRAFVLTLQAREQHIRREKAGSNICSNQAWCALRAAMYMTMMGRDGMREVALQCYANAHYLAEELEKLGFDRVYDGEFFHEFITTASADADVVQAALDKEDILGGLAQPNGSILWCATELTGKEEIDNLINVLKGVAK